MFREFDMFPKPFLGSISVELDKLDVLQAPSSLDPNVLAGEISILF